MFIGHFGVGFGAKAKAPGVSLGTLFLAAQFVDLLWPTLLLLGVEHVAIIPGITKLTPLDFTDYPITHSLWMVCVWGIFVGGLCWVIRKRVSAAFVLGLCVVSHWVLDLVVHRPDLPLYHGGGPRVGLGLWNSVAASVLFEGLIFVVGVILYTRMTRPKNRIGSWGLWGFVLFLLVIHVGNTLGPPPPSVSAVAWAGQLQWLLVAWGYWIDRHRTVNV